MKKLVVVVLVVSMILGLMISASAATASFLFYKLTTTVQDMFPSMVPKNYLDYDPFAVISVKRTITEGGETYTSNLVGGDKVDFRSLTTDREHASKLVTATKYDAKYYADYLSGMGSEDLYILGARSNPQSAHQGVRVCGKWTP